MGTSSLYSRIISLGFVLTLLSCVDNSNPNADAPTGTEGIFEVEPDVPNCKPGKLSAQYQERFVRRFNQIRAQHELPAVAISESELGPTQAAALAIVANAQISHGTSPNSLCYTEEANRSSIESLLLVSAGNEVGDPQDPDRVLRAWLQDLTQRDLGHRRWMLDPFVVKVAYGFVMGEAQVEFEYSPVIGATLDVIDNVEPDIDGAPEFVAYPYELYPADLFATEGDLSFSVIPDTSGRLVNAGKVSFVNAQVSMSADGDDVVVREQRFYETHVSDDIAIGDAIIGVPNILIWKAEDLTHGVEYTVTISDVLVEGETRDYEYTFTLF